MNRLAKILLIVALSAALGGCAGSRSNTSRREKPQLAPRPGAALLVVVRTTSYGWALVIDNYLDGQMIGSTRGNSYFIADVAPGPHYVMARAENIAVARLHFEAGRVYFLNQSIFPGFWKARTGFNVMSLEDGLKQTDDSKCDYRVLESPGEALSAKDFDEARDDFEKEVAKEPQRHRDTLEYRGFAMAAAPGAAPQYGPPQAPPQYGPPPAAPQLQQTGYQAPPPPTGSCPAGYVQVDAAHCCPVGYTFSAQAGGCVASAAPPPAPQPLPAAPPPAAYAPPAPQPGTPCGMGLIYVDAVHCCWPGQSFSPQRQTCAGAPSCPAGMGPYGETCVPTAPR